MADSGRRRKIPVWFRGFPPPFFFNIIIIIIIYKWYAIILWVFYCLTIVLEAKIQQKISEKIKLPTAHDKKFMYGNTFMP